MMEYISTRGTDNKLDFCDVLLSGLAPDGGLYIPENWPQFSHTELTDMANKSYTEVAFNIIKPFVGSSIPEHELKYMVEDAYKNFGHNLIAPLQQIGVNHWLLELFHGPTLAFKDVAMQLLARLIDYALKQKSKKATVVGATSGDTGSAAIEAFRGLEAIDIFILHPHNRVSEVQRRQMSTVLADNVHNIALEGSFDDCQAIVKNLFSNNEFRNDANLVGVNSINWARIVAQIVYYFTSAIALGAPIRKFDFVVPTGNFGDIFAGYVAKQMGLPINKLIVATNINNILVRCLENGEYKTSEVIATTSPSMDIQVSSNFERLLFLASQKNSQAIRSYMQKLQESGGFTIDIGIMSKIRNDFMAEYLSENEVMTTMENYFNNNNILLDPHSAIAVGVADKLCDYENPVISLATAHPAKFPDAVYKATKIKPKLPEYLKDLFNREEKLNLLPNSLNTVMSFIKQKTN